MAVQKATQSRYVNVSARHRMTTQVPLSLHFFKWYILLNSAIRLLEVILCRLFKRWGYLCSPAMPCLAVGDYISAEKDIYYYDPPPTTRCEDKPNQRHFKRLSWCGYFIIILWHLFMITGRLISLALFATVYGRYLFVVLGIHYAMMIHCATVRVTTAGSMQHPGL